MAALIAIEAGRWAAAGRLAERIISGDQHDLFAQRLIFFVAGSAQVICTSVLIPGLQIDFAEIPSRRSESGQMAK